jgi:hypothetical protein
VQIAAFKIVAENNWTFVAADTVPCEITKNMGFNVINPLEN